MTYAFVLLLYWANRTDMQCKVQWSSGMVQYLTPMPLVLTLDRNACSYQVCLHSVIVIQRPTLTTALNTIMISGNYLRLRLYHSQRVNECSNVFVCCIIWSATRNIHRICSLKYFHKGEEKSESDGLTALLSHYLPTCQQSI